MIVFLYGWSKGYVTDIKLISNFIFWGIVMVIRVKKEEPFHDYDRHAHRIDRKTPW